MTSELTPCPLAKALIAAADEVSACGGGNEAEIMRAAAKKLTELNTRTVPDVPELVRYDWKDHGMVKVFDGEYVLHSQAAAMLADALRGNRYAELERIARKRAEAAEAKLAQSEKPIGYVSKSFFESLKIDRFHSIAAYVLRESSERYSEALYTAPVASDADLKAENERLRGNAARIIAAFDEDNDLDNPEKFNAYFDLKAALSPSELRT